MSSRRLTLLCIRNATSGLWCCAAHDRDGGHVGGRGGVGRGGAAVARRVRGSRLLEVAHSHEPNAASARLPQPHTQPDLVLGRPAAWVYSGSRLLLRGQPSSDALFRGPSVLGICSFRYEWHQVAHDVRLLHTLSQRIRQKRFATGSLRLDNTKILFRMDDQGNPCEALPYITKDSNHLVHPNPNP